MNDALFSLLSIVTIWYSTKTSIINQWNGKLCSNNGSSCLNIIITDTMINGIDYKEISQKTKCDSINFFSFFDFKYFRYENNKIYVLSNNINKGNKRKLEKDFFTYNFNKNGEQVLFDFDNDMHHRYLLWDDNYSASYVILDSIIPSNKNITYLFKFDNFKRKNDILLPDKIYISKTEGIKRIVFSNKYHLRYELGSKESKLRAEVGIKDTIAYVDLCKKQE